MRHLRLVREAMQLDDHFTEHFTLREMAVTSHRELLQTNIQQAQEKLPSLTAVCRMLERVRERFCRPVLVHSGYRCLELNTHIGGAAHSQHMLGEACDFSVSGVLLQTVWEWIWKESGLPYGQCLLEGKTGAEWGWIHLSLGEPWRPVEKCRQHLTITT
jgi:uncharacterized protein YcbK (DUF882 family)